MIVKPRMRMLGDDDCRRPNNAALGEPVDLDRRDPDR